MRGLHVQSAHQGVCCTFITFCLLGIASYLFGFFLWYPSPLHAAVGVTKIFLILIAVDVVLGPCLTLLVYKQGKKSLVMDLSIICALQVGALLYGVHAMADGRPAWLVFVDDHFSLVRANEIDERKLAAAEMEYRSPSWWGPKWVSVAEPKNIEEKTTYYLSLCLQVLIFRSGQTYTSH